MDGAIDTVKNALRDRRDAVVTALAARAPRGEVRRAVRAATSCGSSCPRASTWRSSRRPRPSASVLFVKGTDFLLEGGENTLRLAYSGVTPEQIDEGITKLAEAVR